MGPYTNLLKARGFFVLVSTQFLGALNDNTYKMVASLLAVSLGAGAAGGSGYLSLVGAVFILPYILFSGYAGHLADVLSKRTVLVAAKILEIVIMIAGIFAFLSGRMALILAVLFLMALQSTIFSPAKYGIVPEMLPNREISRANGLLEMATFLAIILGTSFGSLLMAAWKENPERIGIALSAIAVAGTVTSLGITRVPPSGSRKPFRLNPWAEITAGARRLWGDKLLRFTVLAGTYFWFLGALLQMAIILFGKEVMELTDLRIGLLLTFLAAGIGAGTFAAGRLSGDKVELGLVPLGSIAMAFFSCALSFGRSYVPTAVGLAALGFAGGLFIVPLNALIQQRSEREEKGRLIATNNFVNTLGILLASGALWLCRDLLDIPADRIMLIFGLLTLAVTIALVIALPPFLIRFTLWMLTHTICKTRAVGLENVPLAGPALLVCNHISRVDAVLVGSCIQRPVGFMIYRPYYETKTLYWLYRLMKALPVSDGSRKETSESIAWAREELREGRVVCVFPEGAISRTGMVLPFKREVEKMVEGRNVPIVPIHIDTVWGSNFTSKRRRFLGRRLQRFPGHATVSFGRPLPSTATTREVRQAVMELGSEAVRYRRRRRHLLHLRFIETAKRRWRSLCMADSTGRELSFGQALIASLLFSRWIRKRCPQESLVGLMLPATAGGALANAAALLGGKVPVNLNFTAGREAVDSAIRQCGIRTILTSRLFLERAKIEEIEGMVFLEDVIKEIGAFSKLLTASAAFLFPSRLLEFLFCPGERNPHALATVIFSSGSTGLPKGIMLSHHNIISNIEGIGQVFTLADRDRIMGVLPLFHSFGFTATLWLPLLAGIGVIYHPNPTEAKIIGEMVSQYQATILISTPTFFSTYIKRCSAEEFSSLRHAIAGAEKLREPIARAFREKYGLELLEGYGCSELAPVVSVNVPDVREAGTRRTGHKPGTVGCPIPGVLVQVVEPETAKPLPLDREGLLLVKGPNVMLGYLGQPGKTSEVLRDGWYDTGDIASVDEDGFIRITDRFSRFSKIGGEMVPHLKVEEAINRILDDQGCVVTAVPDEHKGERLVVFYTRADLSPDELWNELVRTDLPKLWIPKRENLHSVDEIPLLGSGKVDLKKARMMALERAGR